MDEDTYKEAITKAIAELTSLMTEREGLDIKRDALDKRIFKLRDGIEGLAALSGLEEGEIGKEYPDLFPDRIDPDLGLTDAVRETLRGTTDKFLSPVVVRDRLAKMGYDISKYKNPLASIHTVLKRLVQQGEALQENKEGRVIYLWVGTNK